MISHLDYANAINAPRERRMTERGRSVAHDGIADFHTNCGSNNRTQERQEEPHQPRANPETISAPAGAVDQQTDTPMAVMRLQDVNLPRQRPYQVGSNAGGLNIQYAADRTPQ